MQGKARDQCKHIWLEKRYGALAWEHLNKFFEGNGSQEATYEKV
jgi:hypothetical protein